MNNRNSAYNVGDDGMLTSRSKARSVKAQAVREVRGFMALAGHALSPRRRSHAHRAAVWWFVGSNSVRSEPVAINCI